MSIADVRRYAEGGRATEYVEDKDAINALITLLADKAGVNEDDLVDAIEDVSLDADQARAVAETYDWLDGLADETTDTVLPAGTLAATIGHVKAGNPISAIKELRTGTGWGLRPAKDLVEVLIATFRLETRTPQAGSLAGIGLMPSIINELRSREVFGSVSTSLSEDRQLVAALLDDPRLRSALLSFGNPAFSQARAAIAQVLDGEGLDGEQAAGLLRAYDDARDPERARKRLRLSELANERARIESEYAQLEDELRR